MAMAEFDLGQLFAEQGDTTMVEMVEVDDILQVIVVRDRRMRLHAVGPLSAATSRRSVPCSLCDSWPVATGQPDRLWISSERASRPHCWATPRPIWGTGRW